MEHATHLRFQICLIRMCKIYPPLWHAYIFCCLHNKAKGHSPARLFKAKFSKLKCYLSLKIEVENVNGYRAVMSWSHNPQR